MVERKIITVRKMWIYSDGFDFRASGKEDNFHTHQIRIIILFYNKSFKIFLFLNSVGFNTLYIP